MELRTLARPYAKAAFLHAQTNNTVAKWQETLTTLAQVIQHKKVNAYLNQSGISIKNKLDSIVSICGSIINTQSKNFLHLLLWHNRFNLLPQILDLFIEIEHYINKVLTVKVISAYELEASAEKKLHQKLVTYCSKDKIHKDKIQLQVEIDAQLIGGLIIIINDAVIDYSIRGRIGQLQKMTYS